MCRARALQTRREGEGAKQQLLTDQLKTELKTVSENDVTSQPSPRSSGDFTTWIRMHPGWVRTWVVRVRAPPDEAEGAIHREHEPPAGLQEGDELAHARLGARCSNVDAVVGAALDVCGWAVRVSEPVGGRAGGVGFWVCGGVPGTKQLRSSNVGMHLRRNRGRWPIRARVLLVTAEADGRRRRRSGDTTEPHPSGSASGWRATNAETLPWANEMISGRICGRTRSAGADESNRE